VPTDFERWDLELKVAADRLVGEEILRLQRAITFLALGAAVEITPGNVRTIMGVVLRTPVMTGRARASWNVSVGTPNPKVPEPGKKRYQPLTVAGAHASLRTLGPYDIVWITSGLPYIKVLEYGLYPNPPALGTWVPGKGSKAGHFEIRSAGGFSKQAPEGMVRLTVDEIMDILRAGAL
jgi:hypothetical protein